MEYKIKKAKIKNMSLDVAMEEIIYPDMASPITNDVVKKSDQLIHEDLRAAFDELKPHLIMICEQSEASEINNHLDNIGGYETIDSALLDKYCIVGMQVGGDAENPGAVIYGYKRLDLGSVDLTTPMVKYAGAYKHGDDLAIAIQSCLSEVELYLFEGKCAVKQMELPFDEEEAGQNRYEASMEVG